MRLVQPKDHRHKDMEGMAITKQHHTVTAVKLQPDPLPGRAQGRLSLGPGGMPGVGLAGLGAGFAGW